MYYDVIDLQGMLFIFGGHSLQHQYEFIWIEIKLNIYPYEGRELRIRNSKAYYDDVIKWKHFPRYWSFVGGIHRSPVNSPHKGQWCGPLMFSFIYAQINGRANNSKASDLIRHRAHYDVSLWHHFLTIEVARDIIGHFECRHLVTNKWQWYEIIDNIGTNVWICVKSQIQFMFYVVERIS